MHRSRAGCRARRGLAGPAAKTNRPPGSSLSEPDCNSAMPVGSPPAAFHTRVLPQLSWMRACLRRGGAARQRKCRPKKLKTVSPSRNWSWTSHKAGCWARAYNAGMRGSPCSPPLALDDVVSRCWGFRRTGGRTAAMGAARGGGAKHQASPDGQRGRRHRRRRQREPSHVGQSRWRNETRALALPSPHTC